MTTVVSPPWAAPSVGEPEPAAPAAVGVPAVGRARWELPALVVLLGGTAALYLVGLSASHWANSFYSAAAQAGSQSWKALLFGSSDAANSITVDKPPMALWPMVLSVRIFGLSSWSILVPQALMGVATVGILFATVRRRFGAVAGLLAGAALAVTPVAALMFRFNNPDALLVLLMTAAAATLLRGIDDGRARWMVATGTLIGFAFLTKQLQALLVVPGFALVHLVVGRGGWWRRIKVVLLGGVAMIAGAGWWVAIVMLWPARSRPFVGGSQTNSILDLTLGYNGFGRITGNESGSVGGGGRGGGWGETGLHRLFDGTIGGQIAWLVPAAIVLSLGALWYLRRAPRSDGCRALILVFGSWLLVTWLVFSYMQGIFHEYYTVALAAPLAAVAAAGAATVWGHRREVLGALLLAGATVTTALWSAELLRRSPGWNAWLPTAVTIVGVVAAVALLAGMRLGRWVAGAAAAAAVLAVLAGPAAWSVATAAAPHTGSIVTAGPSIRRGLFGGGLPIGGARPRTNIPTGANGPQFAPGQLQTGQFPTGQLPTSRAPAGQRPAGQTPPGQGGTGGTSTPGTARTARPPTTSRMGGLLGTSVASAELQALLVEDADQYTWIAATTGSNNASGYQLATQRPVMPIGGFNGSDPSPTLAQFKQYVADGRIHWYIVSGLERVGSNGGSREASFIAEWVTATFPARQVDGVTLYDLGVTHHGPVGQIDDETAVRAGADGRYLTDLHAAWNIGANLNGGYAMLPVLRAMSDAAGRPDPVSVTVHYLRPAAGGIEGEIATRVVRSGRVAAYVDGTLRQDGTERLSVRAVLGDLSSPVSDAPDPGLMVPAPAIPPPEDCIDRVELDQGVDLPLLSRVEVRVRRESPAGSAVVEGWIRLRDGSPPAAMWLPLFADAFPPAVHARVERVGWVPTLELTVHVRRRPAAGWIQARIECDDVAGGWMIETGSLWDERGALVARSRQLGLILAGS